MRSREPSSSNLGGTIEKAFDMDHGSVPEISEGREESSPSKPSKQTPVVTDENEDPKLKLIDNDHLKVFENDADQSETGSSLKESNDDELSEGPRKKNETKFGGDPSRMSISGMLVKLIHKDAELKQENFNMKVNIVKDLAAEKHDE